MPPNLTTTPTLSLALGCSTDYQPKTLNPIRYRPGDLIPAFIELHKHRPFEALSLHGSLIGQTRTWIHPPDRSDIYQTMIHTHLNLSAGYSHALPSIQNITAGASVIAPLTFVLPEFATDGIRKSADSNDRRLPPSCEVGNLYIDPWGRTYMQPLIEYSSQVTLRFRLPGETTPRSISAKREIKVATAQQYAPPTYSENPSPIKPVTASADVRRSRLAKPFAKLSVAMAEPMPVVGNGIGGKCLTTGRLRLTWETGSEAYDEFESGRRAVRIEYWLQARTRYGTRVVWAESGDEARPNKRLEIGRLGTFEVRSMDRDDVRLEHVAGGWRCHSGTISIPIQVEDDMVPTFSYGLAGRDYLLLVRVQIPGLRHKAVSIRVPVQVCESVAETKTHDFAAKSPIYSDMLLSEILPTYEDHRHSLTP